jgi:hypothetical protein
MQPQAPRPRAIGIVRTILLLLTLLVAACSSGAMEVDPPSGADENLEQTDWEPTSRRTQSIGCADDEVRVCNVYLPEHNGVRPCVVGYQVCERNAWSRCTEGVPQDAGAPRTDSGSPSSN